LDLHLKERRVVASGSIFKPLGDEALAQVDIHLPELPSSSTTLLPIKVELRRAEAVVRVVETTYLGMVFMTSAKGPNYSTIVIVSFMNTCWVAGSSSSVHSCRTWPPGPGGSRRYRA
jgi:hypothetical protein